jgi:hypothetical protein
MAATLRSDSEHYTEPLTLPAELADDADRDNSDDTLEIPGPILIYQPFALSVIDRTEHTTPVAGACDECGTRLEGVTATLTLTDEECIIHVQCPHCSQRHTVYRVTDPTIGGERTGLSGVSDRG